MHIYTPGDNLFDPNLRPTILSNTTSLSLIRGQKNNFIQGLYFNGFSQGSGYGDDFQSYTNFPLVRITMTATNHVFYCRTHDHSSMGVQVKSIVHTYFDVPATTEVGAGVLEVVANGIPSLPLPVTVA
jgi:hypothetical protein